MVGSLLSDLVLVLTNQLLDDHNALLFLFKLLLNLVNPGELVGHIIFHLIDSVGDRGHLVVDAALKRLNLL